MSDPEEGRGKGEASDDIVLLMRTWDDGEAELVRHLLEIYEIPCQVVSDVPHSISPLTVDGLGEVRIFVPASAAEAAASALAEHRRQGLEMDGTDPGGTGAGTGEGG